MDRFDERILRELSGNGRITNADLAERISLSPSACLRRVQELEKRGIIRGYRALLDNKQLGIGCTAYVAVGLGTHTMESQRDFEKAISQSDEVIECHNVTGPFEYLLRVETKDLSTYKRFHTDVLGTLPQVNTITTHVVMDSPKASR